MIAVLKGSTSANCSASETEYSDRPNSPRKITYLTGQSRSCRPQGTVICGTFSHLAAVLLSSCSAPNGQSHPQNGPRPQNNKPAAVADQRMKISGAAKKNSQWNPVTSALVKVTTLTTESCALAYQPSQTSTKPR